jgi:release factor glutamine methyltransferase
MTVLEVIQSAGGYLAGHGVESSRLEAEHLLAKVLQCRRLDLYLMFDRPVSEAERAPLRELAKRRTTGEPLQHLLGEWDFYGRTFRSDGRALIPRPETELLLECVLTRHPAEPTLRVVDVGTGSGILAISLALERPAWSVTGLDLEAKALSLASENAALHEVTDRVQLAEADLWRSELSADLIVANLPYIPSGEIPTLSREVQHDPHSALDGGHDGLELFRRFLPLARQHLSSGGWIALEFGLGQETALAQLAEENGFTALAITRDFQQIPRILEARKADL